MNAALAVNKAAGNLSWCVTLSSVGLLWNWLSLVAVCMFGIESVGIQETRSSMSKSVVRNEVVKSCTSMISFCHGPAAKLFGTLHLSHLRSQFRTLPIMPMKKPNSAGAAQIINVWYFARRASGELFAMIKEWFWNQAPLGESSEHVGVSFLPYAYPGLCYHCFTKNQNTLDKISYTWVVKTLVFVSPHTSTCETSKQASMLTGHFASHSSGPHPVDIPKAISGQHRKF